MRYIFLFFILSIFSISTVSADYIVGEGGDLWSGNSTCDNTTEREVSSVTHVVLDGRLLDVGDTIHLWKFSNGSGTVIYNKILGSDNLILTNTLGWNSDDTIFGNYSLYSASSYHAYKSIGNVVPSIPDNGTIELWFMPDREINSSSDVRTLLDWNFVSITLPAGTGKIRGLVYDNTTDREVFSTRTVWNANEIYKVTLKWGTSGNVTLLVNEIIVNTNTNYDGEIGDVTNDIGIGGFRTSDEAKSFNGTVGDTRISNIERTNTYMYPILGNTTIIYDALSGNETYKLYVNATCPTNTNFSVTTYNNSSGTLLESFGPYTLNQSISLTSKAQDTKVNITQEGNGSRTTGLIKIRFFTQSVSGIDSVDITYRQLNYSNLSANVLIDISNKTAGLQTINLPHIGNLSNEYCLNYPNGTAVQSCVICTGEGDTIWFNGSADRLPELDGYPINETEVSPTNTSNIIIPVDSWGMFNNWTILTNFSNIAANESNDVCYSYYNVTTGEWESYYVGYLWNADYGIPKEASVGGFFDAETIITFEIKTPVNTNLSTGWNMLFLMGTDNETIADIKTDIGVNCTAVWGFNSTAGAYTNTSSYTLQSGEGFLAYLTQNMTPWVRSDL